MLEEQVFDAARHDRADFCCGETALDDYLRRYAAQQSAKGLCSIFVLVNDALPDKMLGFYTLSAAQVDVGQISDIERKKLPRYPVPCFRMGRLAVSMEQQGCGLGAILMGLAVDRCRAARKQVGAYAMLVDAKSDQAKAFYQHFGFSICADSPMTLYLPLG